MNPVHGFLEQEPEELQAFLLAHARSEVAPSDARERALVSVTRAVLGVAGLAAAATTLGVRPSVLKVSTWLAAKWLLIGLGGGLATLTTVHALTRRPPPRPAQLPPSADVPRSRAPRVVKATPLESSVAEAARVAAPASAPLSQKLAPLPSAPQPSRAEPEAVSALQRWNEPKAVSASELARELGVLDRARTALTAHAGARAVQALDEYAAEFPQGALRVEAAALRVEAVGLADPARASALAASFLTDYPTSPLSARVRSLGASYSAPQKP